MNLDSGKGSPFEFFTTNSWTHRGALIHHRRARAREHENTENEKENVLASGFRIKFYSLLAGHRGREAGLKISVTASLQKLPLCDRTGAGGFLAHLLQE